MSLFLPSIAPWYWLFLARLMGEPFYFEYGAGVLITWRLLNGRRLKAAALYAPGCRAVKTFSDGTCEVLE